MGMGFGAGRVKVSKGGWCWQLGASYGAVLWPSYGRSEV